MATLITTHFSIRLAQKKKYLLLGIPFCTMSQHSLKDVFFEACALVAQLDRVHGYEP